MTTTRVRPLRSDVREQIVAAAGEEFAERGYAGTSVAQVAARAGCLLIDGICVGALLHKAVMPERRRRVIGRRGGAPPRRPCPAAWC